MALKLPLAIIGPADVSRLRRGLATYDDQVHQAGIRSKTSTATAPSHPGKLFADLANLNHFDLANAKDRQQLLAELQAAQDTSPVITLSFAVDPSAVFIQKIVDWFRQNIHPALLVRIGLQPNIAAGCTVRTTSRLYDFSLRDRLREQRPMLVRRIHDAAAVGSAPDEVAHE